MLRVFFDHQVTSLQDAGGVSRYYYELARALASTGKVQAELLLGCNRSVFPFSSLRPTARVSDYPAFLPPGPARYLLNEAITTVSGPLRPHDIYHATYQRILPAIRRRAVVATHHDSTPDHYPHLFPDAASIRNRLKKVYARADRIICISASCQADLLRFYDVAPERTQVIHHGFTPLQSNDEQPVDLPIEPYLLYVGARHSYKNFPLLLEALALQKASDLHLVVAGGGSFTPLEVETIQCLRLASRLHLLPRLTDGQLAAAYRNAAMFVYPSLYEGFGFPPLEAMAAGCPALVSRTSALPEICGGAAFYFNPNKVEDLATLITALHNDSGLRLSKCEAGYAQVAQYTWDRTATGTLSAYQIALS